VQFLGEFTCGREHVSYLQSVNTNAQEVLLHLPACVFRTQAGPYGSLSAKRRSFWQQEDLVSERERTLTRLRFGVSWRKHLQIKKCRRARFLTDRDFADQTDI
jgi:hypothetical protein